MMIHAKRIEKPKNPAKQKWSPHLTFLWNVENTETHRVSELVDAKKQGGQQRENVTNA